VKVGISVEVRCPQGSVSFQSHVDCDAESIKNCRKELVPGQVWTWKFLEIPADKISFLAIQSQDKVTIEINGTETLLEGQKTTDFGIVYARRGSETLGDLPFDGDLSQITVRDESGKKNRIDIILGEVPEPVVVTEPETDPMEESDSEDPESDS